MAILLNKQDGKVYVNASGAVTNSEKEIADRIDYDLRTSIPKLEDSWLQQGDLTKAGVKKNTLKIWYDLGSLLNVIAVKYHIKGSMDEPLYWQVVYSYVSPLIQKGPPPKRSNDWRRNHFRLCSKMASSWTFKEVQEVGNWSIWRDIFDNSKLIEDDRVFRWVIRTIHASKLGHKDLRPFLHNARRRLANIDTSVLTDEELASKLKGIKPE